MTNIINTNIIKEMINTVKKIEGNDYNIECLSNKGESGYIILESYFKDKESEYSSDYYESYFKIISSNCDIDMDKGFKTGINLDKFETILSGLKSDKITLELTGLNLIFGSKEQTAKLWNSEREKEEFIKPLELKSFNHFYVNSRELLKKLLKIKPCMAAKTEIRQCLKGICFDERNIISSDGKRLSIDKLTSSTNFYKFILDYRCINNLINLLKIKGICKDIRFEISEDYCRILAFTEDFNFEYTSSLIKQSFPNYKMILDEQKHYISEIVFSDKEKFLNSVKSGNEFCNKLKKIALKEDKNSNKDYMVKLQENNDKIALTYGDKEEHESLTDKITPNFVINKYSNSDKYCIDTRYLLESIQSLEFGEFKIFTTSNYKPVFIVQKDFISAIMPIKLKTEYQA